LYYILSQNRLSFNKWNDAGLPVDWKNARNKIDYFYPGEAGTESDRYKH
jgi:hypothetical protein